MGFLPSEVPPAALEWEAAGQAWSLCLVHSPSSELLLPENQKKAIYTKNWDTESWAQAPVRVYTHVYYAFPITSSNAIMRHNTSHSTVIVQICFDIGHTPGFKPGGTGRTPYLRNSLIAGSTRLRQERPQGEEDWWGSFNNSTNSMGNKKCLQTNKKNQTGSCWFEVTMQSTHSLPIFSVVLVYYR